MYFFNKHMIFWIDGPELQNRFHEQYLAFIVLDCWFRKQVSHGTYTGYPHVNRFKVTGANGITTNILKAAGAPSLSPSLPRWIKYVLYNSFISSAWKLANIDFLCYHQFKNIFQKHIYTENKNLHYKLNSVLSLRHPQPKLELSG